MGKRKLKICAELLDQGILRLAGVSQVAKFLLLSRDLQAAIHEAKTERVDGPRRNPGLIRWVMESDVQDYETLTRLLLDFA